ncbi:class I SAM-dependent methyltransferase [Candidatus Microgenomates bacterium]|nr:MAG: class I SAM-dependent methyltransferase [Candidatus Microgenomates bacterium]
MNNDLLYEDFHKTSNIQKKLIKKNNFTYRNIIKFIDSYLNFSKKNILDIGCGAGTISLYLANRGNKVLGIDISKNAIEKCKKSANFLKLNNVKFEKVNFPTDVPVGKFDFIICSEVIEHLKNDELALKKIFSILNSGGVAIISTPSINAPLFRWGLASEFDNRVGHLRRYSLIELVRKCENAGFKVLETRKTEGLLRNFLFLNPIGGKVLRFIKFFLSNIVTFVDEIFLKIFGESNIFIIVKKP